MTAPFSETALVFGKNAELVGVLTEPPQPDPDKPGFVLLNAGLLHRVGPHRTYVRLARRLAEHGFTTLRFDLSGIGDSGPRTDRLSGRDAIIAETGDAIGVLADRGIEGAVIGGLCSGADHAFRVALADDRVAGVLFIDGYPYKTRGWYRRHYGKRLFRARSWMNVITGKHPIWKRLFGKSGGKSDDESSIVDQLSVRDIPPRDEAEQGLNRLLDRGGQICAIYTAGLLQYVNGKEQFAEMYPSVPIGDGLHLEYLGEADHTCTLLASQSDLIDLITNWAKQTF